MNGIGRALRDFVESDADIDRFVVTTVASMEPYRPPADEAMLFADWYLGKRTPEDEERIRHEVLATTKEQLLQFADLLDALSASATTCIVGGKRQVESVVPDQVHPIVHK